jgi:asparagine synthase (glutamine-hydrolysing)
MCGIIGIFGDNEPKKRAKMSLKKITHRGSNYFEFKYFDKAVLGANRLPIVDRENGKQPKSNEKNEIFVIQNGEIFNYKELKKELIKKGHKFKTDSDTEVLVHMFEEYGPKMIDMIDSEMFAFVIYDKKNNTVFAARDILGVKPLYYAYDKKGQLYFASELKQLSFFDDINKINNFPPGSYFLNGKIKKYFKLKISNKLKKENEIVDLLEYRIVEAVKKRVDTDLPIGVLLSGGIDSSLIMEIATRFHPDVTAIILGFPGSSDYEYALKLCKERNYKYHIIRPDVDYEKELDDLIYHLETYEPLIIRQSFALDICAREAQRLGIRVVLVGEGSDELFGGYNEFSSLSNNLVNSGCLMLTESLKAGHLLRIDRTSMRHTIEIRAPFFDKKIIETALNIDGSLKIKKEKHQIITKYIIRRVANNFLPEYISWRYKIPFSNGAGMNVGNNFKSQDGDVASIVLKKPNVYIDKSKINKYSLETKEEKYYFNKFDEFGFTKLFGSDKRLIVKDNLNTLYKSSKTRFLVGEFDKMAIYFPVYFASSKNIFKLHNLDVDFISTGGDDKTYASLINNSAHIGLADPMFAMFDNKDSIKGEIIGEIVNNIPNVAVSLNPNIKINCKDDFKKYKVGTFQEYTTTHNIAKYILPQETEIIPLDYKEVIESLINRDIDIAIMLPEQAYNIEPFGGKIIYSFEKEFNNYLFTGFTTANILEARYKKKLKSFVVSVRESIRYIKKNKEESYNSFAKMFPELKQPKKVFEKYLNFWSTTLRVENIDYKNAYKVWKKNHPELLKKYHPYFKRFSLADSVIEKINSRHFRRDYPFFEDKIEERILNSLNNKKTLKFVGFWGASNKNQIGKEDFKTINYFKEYIKNIKDEFKGKIEVTWILADSHAINNGYNKKNYSEYLKGIEKYLRKNNFKIVYLSSLWKKWNLSKRDINKYIKNNPKKWWKDVNIAKKLEEQAKKRFKKDNYLIGAQKYYAMRVLEKKFLEKEFKECIFFGFSDGRMQSIYPSLPTIYLYTETRGISESPWFVK